MGHAGYSRWVWNWALAED
ncbi:helix-turn-helix domain-containing protein [Limnoraphis robusta]